MSFLDSRAFNVGLLTSVPILSGLIAGLVGWQFSETIIPWFNQNRWTVPVVASLSVFGVTAFLAAQQIIPQFL